MRYGQLHIAALWVLLLACSLLALGSCGDATSTTTTTTAKTSAPVSVDTAAILKEADSYLAVAPKTVTAFVAERSAGGPHDYYSEGRYWWPNPDDPDGPYIRKDGQSFTGLFTEHRNAVGELRNLMSACALAYHTTGQKPYAEKVREHALAWFVDTATVMNPRLTYGQAIKGITTGRGIGIIDTRSLIYVARAIESLAGEQVFTPAELTTIREWFGAYGDWMVTSDHGIEERDNGNNHSTWWGAQLAAYAHLAERNDLLDTAQLQFRRSLDLQMNEQGVFPDEVGRTRPFHYTEYNLDGFTTLAYLGSTPSNNLWAYKARGGTLRTAIDWYLSYRGKLADWPYPAELEPAPHYEAADYLYLSALQFPGSAYAKTWQEVSAEHAPNDASNLAILTYASQSN